MLEEYWDTLAYYSDELLKMLKLYVLQDKDVDFDWISPIHSFLSQERNLRFIYYQLAELNSTQLILKEQLRYAAFIFIHSQNVIHSEVPLSSNSFGDVRRVKIVNPKNSSSFLNYTMLVPKYEWKSESIDDFVHEFLGMQYFSLFTQAFKTKMLVPSISYASFSKDFLNGVMVQSIMNLVYIKEIELPCILFPEEVGISLECDFFIKDTWKDSPIFQIISPVSANFVESRYFNIINCVGKGASSKCNIREVPNNTLNSSKRFISKEMSSSHLSMAENSSDVSLSPRTQILEEISVICMLNMLEIPYVVKPFTITFPKQYFGNLPLNTTANCPTQYVILYECKEEETKFYFTMEIIHGVDLDKVDFASLDDSTKLSIVLNVTETLNVLHKKGFVHNDLHLGNMRLESSTNRIVILDFGCCEKITKNNAQKDLKYLIKLMYALYNIQPDGTQQYNNVPYFLRPIIKDALKNRNPSQRKYKTVSEILEYLFSLNHGIVIDQKWLDADIFLRHKLYSGCNYIEAFNRFMSNKDGINLHSFTAFLFNCQRDFDKIHEFLKIYREEQEKILSEQKKYIQRTLRAH